MPCERAKTGNVFELKDVLTHVIDKSMISGLINAWKIIDKQIIKPKKMMTSK